VLRSTGRQLPQAYQYPSIACARVECENRVVQSPNFRFTEWEQSASIGTLLARGGRITVCYLEPRPEQAEGPFLEEERELLNTAGELLGERLERERTRELLEEVFAGTHFLIAYLTRPALPAGEPSLRPAAGLKPEDAWGAAIFPLPRPRAGSASGRCWPGWSRGTQIALPLPARRPLRPEILPPSRKDAAATGWC
jgi:hypothetical protein